MDTIRPQLRINPNGSEELTVFIPAFLEDNQIGIERDPGYEAELMKRDRTTAQALRYGRWDVFAGQMFTGFNKDAHTCPPFPIPDDWTRWRAVDWGNAAPFCCLWFARHPQTGRVYVYRELYKTGLTDPRQAKAIVERSLPNEIYTFTFADPSMWKRDTTRDEVTSTADVYQSNGVLLTKANNDNQIKIAKTHAILENLYDDKPGLAVFDTCAALIRTLPALMRDPKDPERLMDGQEDHAWDAFAYGLTNYIPPSGPIKTKKQEEVVNPWLKRRNY